MARYVVERTFPGGLEIAADDGGGKYLVRMARTNSERTNGMISRSVCTS